MDPTLAPAMTSPSLDDLIGLTEGTDETQGFMDSSNFMLDPAFQIPKDFEAAAADFTTDSHAQLPTEQPSTANETGRDLDGASGNVTENTSSTDLNFDFGLSMDTDGSAPTTIEYPMPYIPNFFGELPVSEYSYPLPPVAPMLPPDSYYSTQPHQPYTSSATPALPILYQQYQLSNLTPPGNQMSSLDASSLMYGSKPRAYKPISNLLSEDTSNDPEDLALSPTSAPRRTHRRRIHGPSPLGSGDYRPLTVKERRAPIKNFLHTRSQSNDSPSSGLSSAPDSDGYYASDPSYIPPNTFSINSVVSRNHRRREMEWRRAQRLAYSTSSTSAPASWPSEKEENVMDLYRGMSSPPKIPARRKKHPGRKISVPQTPDVIMRNMKRRQRYRAQVEAKGKAALREYDRGKPGLIPVTELENVCEW